jgi:hypothetical protein
MPDQLAVLTHLAARLDAAGIPYMLTGSIAAGVYGQPRMTRDIDLVAVLYPPHAPRLPDVLGTEFVVDVGTAKDAITARRIFSVIHRDALQKVDIIVRQDSDYEIEKFERRRQVEVDGQAIWMIAPEDLILSKLVWAKDSRSEMQLRDIRGIMALQTDLDWRYIEQWARRLTVGRLLAEIRS